MANREEKIKNINAGLEVMSDEELDQVAGGTFDANMYSKEEYKAAGVAMDSHFLKKDDFFIWSDVDRNGKTLTEPQRFRITYDAANASVELSRQGKPVNISTLKHALGGAEVIRD